MFDIVIIGAGPAGLCAALYAKRSGKSVAVLEAETFGGAITLSPMVENYPATGKISGIEFSDALMQQVEELGCDIELENVLEIRNGSVKTIICEDGEYQAKAVIIATGAKHRALGVSREEELLGKGVSYCAVCDGAFYKGKTVAVVGGGNSALTDALYLAGICKEVYLIHRRDEFRAEDSLVSRVKAKGNIKLMLDAEVSGLSGDNELEEIEIIKRGEKIKLDAKALFVMIGRVPQNNIFRELVDLDEDGYIIAGEDTKTKIPGIYAAGDCRKKSVRQLTTAVADGTAGAIAACEFVDNEF